MKPLFFSLLLFILSITVGLSQELTNGVFYSDSPINSSLITQNGTSVLNKLEAEKTYMVGNALVEMPIVTNTTLYFSGGIVVSMKANSSLTLNLFEQEVKNITATPQKAEFGQHNISLSFGSGEYSIIDSNRNENSYISITTPFTSYQLSGGKYFFRVSDKSVIAYVFEGNMQIIGDKKTDKTDKGKLSVSIPFTDLASGVSDKVISNIKTLKSDESVRFAAPILEVEQKFNNVQFFIINGSVIGIKVSNEKS